MKSVETTKSSNILFESQELIYKKEAILRAYSKEYQG